MDQKFDVLVVEGSRMLSGATANAFRLQGYRVLQAFTATSAEAAIIENGQPRQDGERVLDIGALVLGDHFAYGDERDDAGLADAASAVAGFAVAHGLQGIVFVGYSPRMRTAQELGLPTQSFVNADFMDSEASMVPLVEIRAKPQNAG